MTFFGPQSLSYLVKSLQYGQFCSRGIQNSLPSFWAKLGYSRIKIEHIADSLLKLQIKIGLHLINVELSQLLTLIPNNYFGFGIKSLWFFWNNGWLLENINNKHTVPKWIVQQKIPQMPTKIFGPICLTKPKTLGFSKKKIWVSIVCGHPSSCMPFQVKFQGILQSDYSSRRLYIKGRINSIHSKKYFFLV